MAKPDDINPGMSVEELVERYPDSVAFLMKEGIVCIRCGEPFWGSLGELIKDKGMDVGKMTAKLVTFLKKGD